MAQNPTNSTSDSWRQATPHLTIPGPPLSEERLGASSCVQLQQRPPRFSANRLVLVGTTHAQQLRPYPATILFPTGPTPLPPRVIEHAARTFSEASISELRDRTRAILGRERADGNRDGRRTIRNGAGRLDLGGTGSRGGTREGFPGCEVSSLEHRALVQPEAMTLEWLDRVVC